MISNNYPPNQLLTLEQRMCELCGFTYMQIFKNKYLYCVCLPSGVCGGGGPAVCTVLHHVQRGLEPPQILVFARSSGTNPLWVQRDNLSLGGVKSYTWIFNCVGVSTVSPSVVQGPTVFFQSSPKDMFIKFGERGREQNIKVTEKY